MGKSICLSSFTASSITFGCIYLKITAEDFPVISHGLIQCLTPLAEKDPSNITHIHPLGSGIV